MLPPLVSPTRVLIMNNSTLVSKYQVEVSLLLEVVAVLTSTCQERVGLHPFSCQLHSFDCPHLKFYCTQYRFDYTQPRFNYTKMSILLKFDFSHFRFNYILYRFNCTHTRFDYRDTHQNWYCDWSASLLGCPRQ